MAALDETIVYGLYEDLWVARGLPTAYGAVRTLSAAIAWGIRRGKVKLAVNPARSIGMQTPAPRIRFATRAEISTLLAAADALGRPELGDMIALGLWTGQRQGDGLHLMDRGLIRGGRMFRQAKTGALVAILEAPELDARLQASAARRQRAGIVNAHVILDESCWQPFKADHYRHLYAEVRALAATGDPERGLAQCPSVADFQERDLRDTAVTWMALGQATIPEIASVTGHSTESVHQILKHYLARHPEMADAAIGKMIAWFEGGEETSGV